MPIVALLEVLCTMLDMGPAHLGMGPTVLKEIAENRYQAMRMMFCMDHQFHLCDEDVLKTLDAWICVYTSPAGENMFACRGKYSGLVRTYANIWRSWGTHKKLQRAVTVTYGEDISDTYGRQIVKNAVTGRWCSFTNVWKR